MKLIALVLGALLLCAGVPMFSQAPEVVPGPKALSFPDVVAKVGMSVVMIEVRVSYKAVVPATDNGQPSRVIDGNGTGGGTGFFIDKEWHVVTANHVVDANFLQAQALASAQANHTTLVPDSFHIDAINVKFLTPNTDNPERARFYNVGSAYQAELFKHDDLRDIAILSVPQLEMQAKAQCEVYHSCDGLTIGIDGSGGRPTQTKMTIAEVQVDAPRSGERVSATGFPAFQEIGGQIPGLTTDSGTISNPYLQMPSGFKVFVANMKINHGDSGGPVFTDADGRVIGFVSGFLTAQENGNSGETRIVPIKAVMDLLGSN